MSASLPAVVALLICCSSVRAFYVPGVAPQDFEKEADVDIKVNS